MTSMRHGTPPATVVWLTGLPCSGKSTLARLTADAVRLRGGTPEVLDGDELRRQLSADLGFSPSDRCEQARRAACRAQELLRDGALPIVALVSPSAASRKIAGDILGPALVEIHVDAPVSVCEERDVKGMYRDARRNALPEFTGVSAPYEPPVAPALRLATADETAQRSCERIIALLEQRGAVPAMAPASKKPGP